MGHHRNLTAGPACRHQASVGVDTTQRWGMPDMAGMFWTYEGACQVRRTWSALGTIHGGYNHAQSIIYCPTVLVCCACRLRLNAHTCVRDYTWQHTCHAKAPRHPNDKSRTHLAPTSWERVYICHVYSPTMDNDDCFPCPSLAGHGNPIARTLACGRVV